LTEPRPDTTQPASTLEALDMTRGLSYPATRDELAREAERNGASETTVRALRELPDRRYGSGEELAEALGTAIAPSAAGSGPRGHSAAGDDTEEHPAPVNAPDAGPA
jgi:Protein of unknown function (DUF2795)